LQKEVGIRRSQLAIIYVNREPYVQRHIGRSQRAHKILRFLLMILCVLGLIIFRTDVCDSDCVWGCFDSF